MKKPIAAGIVLYEPKDVERLKKCLGTVLSQTDKLYIFDNSCKDHSAMLDRDIAYISEHQNKGIGYALNRLAEAAERDGYEWLITMDQDSLLPDKTVSSYLKYIGRKDIALICPQVIDKRRSYMKIKTSPQKEYVAFCITSACCTRLSAWTQAGKFDEWLFIDLVDNDFCKRITACGYRILRLNDIVLDQQFGKIIPKSEGVQSFWNKAAELLGNDNFGKLGYKKYVDPMRVYYTNRNIIYVNRKLAAYGKTGYENYNCKGYLGFLICFTLPSILRAQKKLEAAGAALRGIKDGRAVHPRKWKARKLKG